MELYVLHVCPALRTQTLSPLSHVYPLTRQQAAEQFQKVGLRHGDVSSGGRPIRSFSSPFPCTGLADMPIIHEFAKLRNLELTHIASQGKQAPNAHALLVLFFSCLLF